MQVANLQQECAGLQRQTSKLGRQGSSDKQTSSLANKQQSASTGNFTNIEGVAQPACCATADFRALDL